MRIMSPSPTFGMEKGSSKEDPSQKSQPIAIPKKERRTSFHDPKYSPTDPRSLDMYSDGMDRIRTREAMNDEQVEAAFTAFITKQEKNQVDRSIVEGLRKIHRQVKSHRKIEAMRKKLEAAELEEEAERQKALTESVENLKKLDLQS